MQNQVYIYTNTKRVNLEQMHLATPNCKRVVCVNFNYYLVTRCGVGILMERCISSIAEFIVTTQPSAAGVNVYTNITLMHTTELIIIPYNTHFNLALYVRTLPLYTGRTIRKCKTTRAHFNYTFIYLKMCRPNCVV